MRTRSAIGHGAYLFFKDWFLKHYHWENSRRPTHKDLVHVMTDDQGRGYYEFPDGMALPMVRFVKEKEFFEWMNSGLDAETLTELCDAAKGYLTDAMEKPATSSARGKDIAKVYTILEEIGNRKERIIPFDLVINTLCALIVREDEDPFEWNERIHQEKCQYFANHYISYDFFFQFSHFRKLSRFLVDSKENWTRYLAQVKVQIKNLQESLKIYSTRSESKKESKRT